MKIIHGPIDADDYLLLRKYVNWPHISKDNAEKALRNDLFSVHVTDDNETVGIGRVIGDGSIYYYIQDLIVRPDYQRRGIGSQILHELLKYTKSHASPNAFIGLIAADGAVGFYELHGFLSRNSSGPGMYYKEPLSNKGGAAGH
jgi:ribosomal protein S18 acetylase RimI-like enzyme